MKFTIKDKRFIQNKDLIIDYIQDDWDDTISKDLLKGLTNANKVIENSTEFDYQDYRLDGYVLVNNSTLGSFIVREDNLTEIVENEDILELNGIEKIIRSGNKTILIDSDGSKYITTRQKDDKDDVEKAVMILLLKKEGYSVNDIYTIISAAK